MLVTFYQNQVRWPDGSHVTNSGRVSRPLECLIVIIGCIFVSLIFCQKGKKLSNTNQNVLKTQVESFIVCNYVGVNGGGTNSSFDIKNRYEEAML